MKLLPPAPGGALALKTTKISAEKVSPRSSKLLQIKTKVIAIDKITKNRFNLLKKEEGKKSVKAALDKRASREKKLESKKTKEEKQTSKLRIPPVPFFDRIKNFIFNTLLGFALTRLVDETGKINPIIPIIADTLETAVDLTLGFVDGLGTTLKKGYELYDGLKQQVKDKFGEDGEKKLEELTGALNKFFNVAILAGFAAAISGRGGGKPKKKRKKPRKKPDARVDSRGRTATERLKDQRNLRRRNFGQRLFASADRLTFGLLGKGKDLVQSGAKRIIDIGKALKSKYDNATKAIGGAFNKLGNAAKEQFVKRILDPAMVFLNPILDKVKGIGDKILKQIEKIPGFGRVVDFLKKQGVSNLGDVGKLAKKLGAKAIPIIGGILNFLFAYDRLAQGDSIGGLLEAVSGAFDVSGIFGFVPGPGISMGIDAYMFARDLIPGIQEGEESIINSLGLGGLKTNLDNMFSKLPDLSTIVKTLTGAPQDQSLMQSALGGNKPTTTSPPTTPSAAGRAGTINVGGSDIVSIGKDLAGKGFTVAEHPDFTKDTSGGRYTPGQGYVSNVHSGDGHYDGRAIDVTDFRGSMEDSKARYRSVLDDLYANRANNNIKMLIHDSWGDWYHPNASKAGPGKYSHPEHMHIETKDNGGLIGKGMFMNKGKPEFVLDADSTKSLEDNVPGFLDALNKADYSGALAVLRNYAFYETSGVEFIPVPVPQTTTQVAQKNMSGSGFVPAMSGGDDPYERLYMG